ncbi:MAG: epoxyqueuosine reductase QueH [Eggerthellaceae bacterium]|nr:epoxyqueuosine reductase QueH [Eggerthellaceae bacterium]
MDSSVKTQPSQKRMLLHACCAPCSLEPTRILIEEGFALSIYYANSNIQPKEEYLHRLYTLKSWATSDTANRPREVIEGAYDADTWEKTVGKMGEELLVRAGGDVLAIKDEDRSKRCRMCYRMRFEETAKYAAKNGFDIICTTLSVSPYQFTDIIEDELLRAAKIYSVEARFVDFRENYPEATKKSKEIGMYRQNFCGCRFSAAEAAAQRARRKLEKQKARDEYLSLHADEIKQQEEERLQKAAKKMEYAQRQAAKHALVKAYKEQMRQSGNPSSDEEVFCG